MSKISVLMDEVFCGEQKKDVLQDSSYDFAGEVQASYFSAARNNLHTDMARAVFETDQNLDDLKILKEKKE